MQVVTTKTGNTHYVLVDTDRLLAVAFVVALACLLGLAAFVWFRQGGRGKR